MLDFFKKIIRKEEEKQPVIIRFQDIPAMLEQKKRAAISRLEKSSEKDRAEIREATGRLKSVIHALLAAQFNEDIHPKLKSIAQKSLPLYTKAIEAALEKPLPDEPAEFYSSAAELLKICINSATGQGKYLRTVFPDEMKAASACVADIGRSINAMNRPLGEYRTDMARIGDIERIHAALTDINVDLTKAHEKENRMTRRIREINDRIDSCEHSVAELEIERNGPDLSGMEREIILLKKEQDLTIRRYATVSMTASHVLRKAEKVARRKKMSQDERLIARAIALLSDHTIPDTDVLVEVLDAAFVPARRMIDAGEIALKNKEERTLFSSRDSFSEEIRTLCGVYAQQAAESASAEKTFCSHPVISRHTDVTRELRSLSDLLSKENQALADLVQWRDGLNQKIPALRQQLEKGMGLMNSGSDVQIHYPDDSPHTSGG